MNRIYLLWITLCSFSVNTFSQSADSLSIQAKKTELVAGVTYLSALNYYGRQDSLKSSALTPFVGVNFRNGLYLNSSFIFLHNALSTEYAATTVEGGYQFRNHQQSWAGNVFASANFYKDISYVQAAVKGSGGANITHLNKILNINLGADVKFGDQLDYGATGGIDHIIKIQTPGKVVFVIDPSAYAYAGTQNFTKTYYKERKFIFLPAGQEQVTENSKKLSILAYEFSCPVIVAIGKMQLILTPAYTIPENVVTATGEGNGSSKLSPLFWVSGTVRITL